MPVTICQSIQVLVSTATETIKAKEEVLIAALKISKLLTR